MSFLEYGIRAVVQNQDGFTNAIEALRKSTDRFQSAIQSVQKQFSGFTNASGDVTEGLGAVEGAAEGSTEAMAGLAEGAVSLSGVTAGLSIVVAALVAEMTAFIALAQRGAGFSEIERGFAALTNQAHVASEELLRNLHDAVGGTVSDMQLLNEVNRTLIGTTGEFGHAFGEALPALMKIAKANAEATGKDVSQVFDQITMAVRRGQTRMLMMSGIIIDQKKAFEEYAKSIGKSTSELTQQDREMAILNATLAAGQKQIDAMGAGFESNADKAQRSQTTITNLFDRLSETIQPVWGMILDGINAVLDAISSVVSPIIANVGAIISLAVDGFHMLFDPVLKWVGTIINLPKLFGDATGNFARGGAMMIGALAQGILLAANTVVFPAIEFIAKGIADFLVGLSPPPKGPLSLIDQGGANVMGAWIEGFTGVSLEPVEEVAGKVNSAMGTIATDGAQAVADRLAQLDKAIQPFKNQLDIVKSQFDAIRPAEEAAMRSIDRQIAKAQEALKNGDQTAAETVRALDAQKQQLQDYVDTQQDAIDNAQIQLSLAEAQQARERAMLDIRKQEVGAPKKAEAPKKGGGGGGAQEEVPGIGGAPGAAPGFDIAGIQDAKANIQAGFEAGLGTEQLQAAKGHIDNIQASLKTIGSVDIGSKLGDTFKKLFDPSQDGSIPHDVIKWFNDTFSFDSPTSIWVEIKNMPTNVTKALTGLPGAFSTVFHSASTTITKWFTDTFDPAVETSLPHKFSVFVTEAIPTAFVDLEKTLTDSVITPLGKVFDKVIATVSDIFESDKPGIGINYYIREVLGFFAGIPDKIKEGLLNLGKIFMDSFVTPVVDVANHVIDAINQLIASVFDGIKKTVHSIADSYSGVPGVPDLLRAVDAITAPKFDHVAVPAAASGGIFGPGLIQVGEKGRELIAPAQSIAVFPNAIVRAMDRISNILANPMPRYTPSMVGMGGGGQSNSTDRSMNNFTFNGVQGSGDVVRRMAFLQALQ